MKLFVDVASHNIARRGLELEVEPLSPGSYRVRAGGQEHAIEVLHMGAHEATLLMGGRALTFRFEESHGRLLVFDRFDAFEVRVTDERMRAAEALLGRRGDRVLGEEVRSIMPGIVTRLLVAEGAIADPGAPLLIIEAMKMENEVRCTGGGVVRRLHVAPGSTVNAGDILAELAPAGQPANGDP
jgi:biotin carboxyl carrier protein